MNSKDFDDKLDKKEIELVSLSDAEMRKEGYVTYLAKTITKVYPLARAVAELSPNEKVIFEDGLAKFQAVRDGSK